MYRLLPALSQTPCTLHTVLETDQRITSSAFISQAFQITIVTHPRAPSFLKQIAMGQDNPDLVINLEVGSNPTRPIT
jgi:hypothetical protein